MVINCSKVNFNDMGIHINYSGVDGGILGIIITSILVLIGIIIYLICFFRMKKKKDLQKNMERTGAHVDIDIQSNINLKSYAINQSSLQFQPNIEVSSIGSKQSSLQVQPNIEVSSNGSRQSSLQFQPNIEVSSSGSIRSSLQFQPNKEVSSSGSKQSSLQFQPNIEVSFNGSSISNIKLTQSLKKDSVLDTLNRNIQGSSVVIREESKVPHGYTWAFNNLNQNEQGNLNDLIKANNNSNLTIKEEGSSNKTMKDQYNFYTENNKEDISSYNSSNLNDVFGEEILEEQVGKYVDNVEFVPIKSNGKVIERDLSPQAHSELFGSEDKESGDKLEKNFILEEEEFDNDQNIKPKRRRSLFS